jgi:hypothetical protein
VRPPGGRHLEARRREANMQKKIHVKIRKLGKLETTAARGGTVINS